MKSTIRRVISGSVLGLVLAALTIAQSPAPGAEAAALVVVSTVSGGCGNYITTNASTISAGVALLPASGGTVVVCPGPYGGFTLNGLTGKVTIKSALEDPAWMPLISPPTVGGGAVISIINSKSVTLDGLYITGVTFNDTLTSDAIGVEFFNSSGAVQNSTISALRNYPNFGGGAGGGFGVVASNDTDPVKVSTITVKDNNFSDVETTMVRAIGHVKVTTSGNYVLSNVTGTTSGGAGIQYEQGAAGTISDNQITNFTWGIELSGVSKVTVSGNIVADSSTGIFITSSCDSGHEQTNSNKITGNTMMAVFYGIVLYSNQSGGCVPHVDMNTISNNIIGGHQAFGSGVSLSETGSAMAEKNKVTGNRIVSFTDGYLPGTTDNTTFSGNTILP